MAIESKHDLVIRNIRSADIDEIAVLSLKVFGPEMALKREHFESQLDLFPEGQVCILYEGKIVGCAISLIIDIDDYGYEHNYDQISDNGFIRNHKPTGKNLYGIEVGVDPDYRNMKLGKLLYNARKRICKELNLKSILVGGRMPNYYKYAAEMNALKYAKQVVAGNIYDPVATFQSKNDFHLLAVIPHYIKDEASQGYAALMEWGNEAYEEK